ncbi:Dabb family protein [Mycolicibacterium setense]|nr:Dabb family protein [Mycolicibacterium setense]KHO21664.1 hypothetical protein QQ25_14035 [Mycolicibacterium setense]MCV7114218.1 Dabb family protein [Mycolicibacterium setense]OBB13031.1 hypothetical protein A5761_20865 [Mycolicibacterium setense]
MSVCHVVTFTFKPGTPDAAIAKLGAALDGLAIRSGATSYRHGRDLQRRVGNADYSVTALFDDYDSFTTYLESPEHLGIVSELLAPHLESRSAVQFAVRGR